MILECDVGNTCCKWRIIAINDTGLVNIIDSGCFAHVDGFSALPQFADLKRVRVASVATDSVLEGLLAHLQGCSAKVEFARVTATAAGVKNGYGKGFAALGVDRWLAAVAAYNEQQAAVLILDVGTALKADLVAADGQHLGGYILPGTELMNASLQLGTAKVRFDANVPSDSLVFGCCTAEAVQAGVLASQLGAIAVAVAEAGRQIPDGFAILLTGGGALGLHSLIESQCGSPVESVPDLVLNGLALLLP